MDKIKILFLAANPASTPLLKLDEEIRSITEKLRLSEHRQLFDIQSSWAVRTDDLLQTFNEHKPYIVHFSGHGHTSGEIILLDGNRQPKPVSTQALQALFHTLKANIRVVILNACYSQAQAKAITTVIDCAIGIDQEINDQAAITFVASFYRAIGFGLSVQEAYEQGKTALLLDGFTEEDLPELLVRNGIDPATLYLQSNAPKSLSKLQKQKSFGLLRQIKVSIATVSVVAFTVSIIYFLQIFSPPLSLWEYISGKDMDVSSIAIHNGYLYLGVARDEPRSEGLYRADIRKCTKGLSLTRMVEEWPIYDLAFLDNQGLAVAEGGIVYHTLDSGNSWEQIRSKQLNARTYSIIYIGQSVYVGTEKYYIYTAYKDNPNLWTALGQGPQDVNTFEYYNGSLWIGTYSSGIWKLALDENRFSNQSEGLTEGTLKIRDIIFDSRQQTYVATPGGVFTNNGVGAWESVGLQNETIFSLEIAEEYLYAGTQSSGLFRMQLTAPGEWIKLIGDEQINVSTIRELIYDPIYCKGLLAATDSGVWLLKLY